MDEALIQEIVLRVVALMTGGNGNGKLNGHARKGRKVVVIFSGASTGQVEGLEAIRQMLEAGHKLTVVLTSAGQHLLGERLKETGVEKVILADTWADAPGMVRENDLFLVPTLSMNFASRLSLGLLDTLPTTLIAGALLAGKPVVAIRDGADPDGSGGKVFGAVKAAAALRAKLSANLKILNSYGVELVSPAEFFQAVENHLTDGVHLPPPAAVRQAMPVEVLTQADLMDLPYGSVLRLPPGSRLTPLAHEMADRQSIQLIYE